jgi:hypothetical protein
MISTPLAMASSRFATRRMSWQYVRRLKLDEDTAYVAWRLLREKVKETRMPFKGPI